MDNFLDKLRSQINKPRIKYNPLIQVKIFKDNLINNLREYEEKYPDIKFAPVLKSNAYGHGLIEVAEILDNHFCDFFVVDSFYEALVLRQHKIKTHLLIIGFVSIEQLNQRILKDVSFSIIGLDQLIEISNKLKYPQKFHLKIDTGMCRQGILLEQVKEAIRLIKNNKNIVVEGLCSHLSDADNDDDDSFCKKQIEKWNEAVNLIGEQFPCLKYGHISATAGIKYWKQANANLCRLGIGLYGVIKQPGLNLKPCLEMSVRITGIKNIKKDSEVGYNRTFRAPLDMKVATLAAGYYEGVDRRLSNKGLIKIEKHDCPIIGIVSMNITTIDVGQIEKIKVGDEAIIISSNPEDSNSVEAITKICDTIPYEILIHIPSHLRRTIV